jgi:hypothetical protein
MLFRYCTNFTRISDLVVKLSVLVLHQKYGTNEVILRFSCILDFRRHAVIIS